MCETPWCFKKHFLSYYLHTYSIHISKYISLHVVLVSGQVVPEAKFIFDLSPIAVTYKSNSKRWYDYLTSIMAIIGGVFTVVGMIEASINVAAQTVQKRRNTPKPIKRGAGYSNTGYPAPAYASPGAFANY
jgi:hypothetical protein